jgi:ketosteroid isomerase-like protein
VAEASATGGESGAEVGQTRAQVMTVRDGLIPRVDPYPDRDAALKAAGLSEQAMSRDNVDVVRRLYELFGRRDVGAAFPDYADPGIELRVPQLYPDAPEAFLGRKGVEDWIAMVDEVWSEWRFEPKRYLEAGSIVVVLARLVAEGESSGIHLQREVAHLWEVKDGRATSIQAYLNPAEALEAAGLEE